MAAIETRPGLAGARRALGGMAAIEARPGLAGARRALGGMAAIETRPGLAGARRALGGMGGHFGAPHQNGCAGCAPRRNVAWKRSSSTRRALGPLSLNGLRCERSVCL